MQGTTYKYDTNSIGIIPKSDTDALYPNAMREALWKKRFSFKRNGFTCKLMQGLIRPSVYEVERKLCLNLFYATSCGIFK